MASLEDCGFSKAGDWRLDEGLKNGVRCVLSSLGQERVVYAFMVERQVKYVGVCDKSSTTLKDRMGRYQGRVGGGTNERVAELIKSCLEAGGEVEVWALVPEAGPHYGGLPIDLVKGLENPLIQRFDPEWNKHK